MQQGKCHGAAAATATVMAVIIWRRALSAAITGTGFVSIFSPRIAPQGQTCELRIHDAKSGSFLAFPPYSFPGSGPGA